MIVTAIERLRGRRRVSVHLDGEPALTLGADLAAERKLARGMELSPAEVRALEAEDARRSAYDAALRLLSYRPRSERELRLRLRQKGFAPPVVRQTLARLRALGYVNDEEFARFYTETKQAARPRSRRAVASELRRQGVEPEMADAATEGIDDEAAAYEAASRRLRAFQGLAYRVFRERLGRFLTSRGFSYDVSRRVVDRCWEDLGGDREDLEVE